MKKVLSIVMVVMLLAMTVVVFASCSKPADNPDDALAALKENGYTAEKTEFGGNTVVTGMKGTDMVVITWYADEAAADAAYEALEAQYEKAEDAGQDVSNSDYGQSGNMVWYGTKDAIDAAK